MAVSSFTRNSNGDITIKQGATVRWQYAPKDVDGNSIDLTGWTARMQVRESFDSAVVVLELTTENGKIENDGVQFVNKISATDSSEVSVTGESLDAVYDYEVIDAEGKVIPFDSGSFTILREITR